MRRQGPHVGVSRGWFLALVAGALAGSLAGAYLGQRPGSVDATPGRALYVVRDATVGRTLNMPVAAAWQVEAVVRGQADGVITQLVAPAGYIEPGDVLLRVSERPIVALSGEIPAFRRLNEGIVGRDAEALNSYLARAGYGADAASAEYSATTREAVATWQSDLGTPATGDVELGDVIFLPEDAFAAPVQWADGISVGATLASGVPLLERVGRTPELTIEFGGGSPPPELIPGVTALAKFESGPTKSLQIASVQFEIGRWWAELRTIDDAPLCVAADCLSLVPLESQTVANAAFVLVPDTTGPMVPTGAIGSDAAGNAFVEMADGTRRPVTLLVSSGGSAIVEGVSAGDTIVLP